MSFALSYMCLIDNYNGFKNNILYNKRKLQAENLYFEKLNLFILSIFFEKDFELQSLNISQFGLEKLNFIFISYV